MITSFCASAIHLPKEVLFIASTPRGLVLSNLSWGVAMPDSCSEKGKFTYNNHENNSIHFSLGGISNYSRSSILNSIEVKHSMTQVFFRISTALSFEY